MKVKEFVDGYKSIAIDKLKISYLNDKLNVKKYIDIATKCNIAERIADVTMFVYREGIKTNEINNDSIGRFLLSTLSIIDMYTDLEIDFSNVFEEYDLLAKDNIISLIIGFNEENQGLIPYGNISEMQTLVAMNVDDIIQNNLSAHAFIQNQVSRFGELIGITLSPIMDKITKSLGQLDESAIEKFSKHFDSVLKKIK